MRQLRVEVINRHYPAILAAKTPAERIAMADAAHRTARTMVLSRVRQLYPSRVTRASTESRPTGLAR